MDYYKPRTYISKYHNIKLELTDLDEPNYGRMVWRYKFYINNVIVENKFINDRVPFLIDSLADFQFENDTGDFMFLPLEGSYLLYESITNVYTTLNISGRFVKNRFYDNRLIVIQSNSLIIIDLYTKHKQRIIFSEKTYNLLDVHYIDNILMVTYKDLSDYNEYTKRYDFKKMDFQD